ncbi:Succinyl-diaminopimelate desuccinylase [subsurface metagenome]
MKVDKKRIIAIAENLIKYRSFTGKENDIGGYVSGFFRNIGVKYNIFEKKKGRPNIIARIGSGEKTIAINGHLDIVPVANEALWQTDPFRPEVKGNRLYGRGAYDMKASCAVMMHVAEILAKEKLDGSLQIHLVSDEEKGAEYGTRHIIELIEKEKIKKPGCVIVGEGSELKIRSGERGIFIFKIKLIGRASHTSSSKSNGVNAIILASKAVLAIDKEIDKFHPEIGSPVISVNMISGGRVHNQVPGECVITVDRRTLPGETKEAVRKEIEEQLTAGLARENYEFLDVHYDPANITPRDSSFVNLVYRTVNDVLNIEPEFYVGEGGVTDARFYRYAGIPTVIYGPRGEHSHGPNEYVEIDSLEKQAHVYLEIIERALSVSKREN